MGWQVLAHGFGPVQYQRVAQADFTADMQHLVQAFGARQIPSCGFPGLQQLIGVDHEGFPVAGQSGACAVANEQCHAEQAFEFLHPGRDGCLGDMKFLGGTREAAAANNFEKGPGQVEVHDRASLQGAVSVRLTGQKT